MFNVPFDQTHKPGTYKYAKMGGFVYAMFTCPYCETSMTVGDKKHIISEDGIVHPSVVCPTPNCFHEFVKFEDWSEN